MGEVSVSFKYSHSCPYLSIPVQSDKINTILNIVFRIVFISPNSLKISPYCGDGRSRTAVQTPYQIAFYTFIRPLVVGSRMPDGGLTGTYPLGLGGV